MRLNEKEINNIIKAIGFFVEKAHMQAELRLYGSRTNDKAKGGDIDLLLLVATQEATSQLNQQKPEILVAIKKLLGERRIDLKIAAVSELNEEQGDPFLKVILPQSILLHNFAENKF